MNYPLTLIHRPCRYLGLALVIACASPVMAEPLPAVVEFGDGLKQTAESLDTLCSSQTVRVVEPPQIPGVSEQIQLDCEGFDYFGRKRKAEFIFGDDALTIMWILIEASEIDDLVAAFMQTFGLPTHDTPDFTAFADDQAAVRKDVPEALYYAPEVAAAYRGWFDQQAGTD